MQKKHFERGDLLRLTVEMGERESGFLCTEYAEATGFTVNDSGARLTKYCRTGYLTRGKRGGERLRYFSVPAAAAEWVATAPVLTAIGERIKSNARQPSKPPPDLAGSTPIRFTAGASKMASEAPSELEKVAWGKITYCPSTSFDSRYQVDPKTRIEGGFATMGIARYES